MESILADPRITVVCVTRMIGLAVFVTTAERLCHYRDYAIGGILSPATRRFREKRFGSLVDAVFGFPGFPLLMLSRALAGLGLTILADKHDIAGCCLLVIVLFCLLRDLRDGIVGDSIHERMVMLVCGALLIGLIAADSQDASVAVLAFIAVNSILSYSLSVIAKLQDPEWIRGEKAFHVLNWEWLGSQPLAAFLRDRPLLTRILTWKVLAIEALFPIVLVLGLPYCLLFLAWGLCFHLFNWAVLGLRGFTLTWTATYPAVIYISERVHHALFGI